MSGTSRCDVLRAGATLAAGLAGASIPSPATAAPSLAVPHGDRWAHDYTFGHTILFMEEYHRGTMEILGCQSGELDQIGELTSRATHVIRNGGTVWKSMDSGHMPHFEQQETRRGNPRILKEHNRDFERLKRVEMVFTNLCNKDFLAARERSVYIVCVTVNYHDNEFRPQGFTADDGLHSNPDGLMLRDVSNEILHSHVPYYQ